MGIISISEHANRIRTRGRGEPPRIKRKSSRAQGEIDSPPELFYFKSAGMATFHSQLCRLLRTQLRKAAPSRPPPRCGGGSRLSRGDGDFHSQRCRLLQTQLRKAAPSQPPPRCGGGVFISSPFPALRGRVAAQPQGWGFFNHRSPL